jgi:hypothetical protein
MSTDNNPSNLNRKGDHKKCRKDCSADDIKLCDELFASLLRSQGKDFKKHADEISKYDRDEQPPPLIKRGKFNHPKDDATIGTEASSILEFATVDEESTIPEGPSPSKRRKCNPSTEGASGATVESTIPFNHPKDDATVGTEASSILEDATIDKEITIPEDPSPSEKMTCNPPTEGASGATVKSTFPVIDPIISFLEKNPQKFSVHSRNYFINEHTQKGNGKKMILAKALGGVTSAVPSTKGISDYEADYHFMLAKAHNDSTRQTSELFSAITNELESQINHEQGERSNSVKEAYRECHDDSKQKLLRGLESLQELLNDATELDCTRKAKMHRQIHLLTSVADRDYDSVERGAAARTEEILSNKERRMKFTRNPDKNRIRCKYRRGEPTSIHSYIPRPTVSLVEHGLRRSAFSNDSEFTAPANTKKRKYAEVAAEEIVNHLLAAGVEVRYFRAGYEDDWYADINTKTYECQFIRDIHNEVLQRMHSDPNITKDTRVIIIRIWSDGFQNKQIKGVNTEWNSIQAFTLTLMPPNGKISNHTVPCAITFKKDDHHDVLIEILRQIKKLENPELKYWGGDEREVHNTMCFMDVISNDLPERCGNTCVNNGGIMGKRWRYIMMFNDKTASCASCVAKRIDMINKNEHHLPLESCGHCKDWTSGTGDEPLFDMYPIQPGEDASNPPTVESSFKLLRNSIDNLQSWYQERSKKAMEDKKDKTKKGKERCKVPNKGELEAYLQLINVQKKLEMLWHRPL